MKIQQSNMLTSPIEPTNRSLVELSDEQLDQVTGGSALVLNLCTSNTLAGVQSAYSARGWINSDGKAAFNVNVHVAEGSYHVTDVDVYVA
jgi:hypothetical protein